MLGKGLDAFRQDLAEKCFAALWPWEWKLLGCVCSSLLRRIRAIDDCLLGALPGEWLHSCERLRRFIVSAAERGERRWILALASADPSAVDGLLLLQAVCRGGHSEAGKMLLRVGADVDLRDRDGAQVLHIAALQNSAALVDAIIEAMADVNAASGAAASRGPTPLIAAATACAAASCAALLAAGADVDLPGGDGMRALAVASAVGAPEVLTMLIDARAELQTPLDCESKALHEAAANGHVECASLLLVAGTLVDDASARWGTALHVACRRARTDVAELLLSWRANPNSLNEQGQTPLGLAFQASQRSRSARASFKQLREKLIAAGAALGEFNPTLYNTSVGSKRPTLDA